MAWDCSRHRVWRSLQSRAKETKRLHEADCFCVTGAGTSMWKKYNLHKKHVSRSGVGDETGNWRMICGQPSLRLFAPHAIGPIGRLIEPRVQKLWAYLTQCFG